MISTDRKSLYSSRIQGVRATAAILTAIFTAIIFLPGEARAQAGAAETAVVLVYQRFGEDKNASNSVKLSEFEAHIAELTNGKYNVLPLPEILTAIEKGERLPNRTVAITIDDTFRSVYQEAWPRLKKAGLPFTLFVATDPSDMGSPAYLTWDEIREFRDSGVTIGAHTASHMLASQSTTEELRADIERSLVSFQRELGERPKSFPGQKAK